MKHSTRAWLAWAISMIFVIFQFTQQLSAGVYAHAWRESFNLDAISLSYLSSSFYYGYLILQIPAGIMFDRYGPRRVLTGAAFTMAVGCLLFAFANAFTLAMLGRILMGCGATFAFVGTLCLVAEWFEARQFAAMISITETTGMIITSLTVVVISSLMAYLSWRYTLALNGILALVVAALAFVFIRDRPPGKPTNFGLSKPKLTRQLKKVFCNRDIWLCGIYGLLAFSFLTTFASLWGVPFLVHSDGMSLHLATKASTMVLVGIAIGGPLVSFISNRLGRRRIVLSVSAFIAFIASAILCASHNLPVWIVFVLILLVGIASAGYILAFTVAKEVSERRVSGTAMAAVNLITMTSGIILQPLIGWLIHSNLGHLSHDEHLTYQMAMIVFPLCFLLAVGVAMLTRETYCRSLED